MPFSHSALDLHRAFLTKTRTAVDIVSFYLDRIKRYDPQIDAFLSVSAERALKKAEELDEKLRHNKPVGRLAAIPIAVKDNINVQGEISTCGSKILENFRSPFSATSIRLIEEEDGIIIGKTNCDEFAMGSSTEHSAYKMTKNPWALSCTPGGSSGGSGAAIGARLCPIALGSDTGGSVRQPGALCGIAAFKPTYGRVSRFGLVAYGSSLDQIGPMAATVEDLALMMEIIGRQCEKDSTSVPRPAEAYLDAIKEPIAGLKIGVPWQFLEGLSQESRKNFDDAIDTLKGLGATICDINLSILKYSLPTYYIIATAEASTNLARYDGVRYGLRSKEATTLDEVYDRSREEGFGPEVKRRILLGTFVLSAGYQDAYYKKAQKVRALIISKFQEAFSKCDLIAIPTVPNPAFELGSITDPIQMYLEDIYTIGANLAGIPAINVPSGFTKDKKPLGLQLLGAQMADVQVLRAAYAYQEATNYHKIANEQFSK